LKELLRGIKASGNLHLFFHPEHGNGYNRRFPACAKCQGLAHLFIYFSFNLQVAKQDSLLQSNQFFVTCFNLKRFEHEKDHHPGIRSRNFGRLQQHHHY
jgi:hypothetical protein